MFDYTVERITEALMRHPKSLIYRTEEDRKRVLNNPHLAKYRSDLESCLKHYMEKPIYSIPFSMLRRFEDDGDRSEFEYSEKGYFARRGHLEIKLVSAWLYPERRDVLDALQDIMWAICDEYTWSLPAHMSGAQALRANLQEDCYTIDLFAAETGDTLAEALMMLGDRLDPVVVKRVKRELNKRIIDRFESGSFGWCESTTNNWAAVCAGSVGMACICELDDNVRLGQLMERILGAMRNFMSGFSADGACLEGTGYWSYGFGYFACFADMLYRRTGGEIDLFNDPHVHKVAMFPQKCCFYGSRGVSFSDSGSKVSLSLGLTNMLSGHYEDVFIPENVDVGVGISIGGCHRFSLGFNNVLWTPEGDIKRVPMEGNYQLPSAQWYIASGKDNVGVAIKGGNNGEPHNHNDVGNFIVYKNGVEIIADLGSGEYNKKYFSGERYTLTHCGSQGHCVPIIDGAVQKAGKAYAAGDFTIDSTGVCMDIAPAYALEGENTILREVRFDKAEGILTVSDSFKLAKAPEKLIERFISRNQPEITVSGVVFGKSNASMLLTVIEGDVAVDIHCSEEKDHSGKPFTVWYVDFAANSSSTEYSFKFKLS